MNEVRSLRREHPSCRRNPASSSGSPGIPEEPRSSSDATIVQSVRHRVAEDKEWQLCRQNRSTYMRRSFVSEQIFELQVGDDAAEANGVLIVLHESMLKTKR